MLQGLANIQNQFRWIRFVIRFYIEPKKHIFEYYWILPYLLPMLFNGSLWLE